MPSKALTIDGLKGVSTQDFQGSRLVGNYYCYMGDNGIYNHNKFVNINAAVNSVLNEPADPVRSGYSFGDWFRFDDVPSGNPEKIYLEDVLSDAQNLNSYGENHVYLNHVGDAFLLHEDGDGRLYYYPDQTGYRYSYANNASVVSRNLHLYAAWIPNGDDGVIYHLVEKDEVNGDGIVFTPSGNEGSVTVGSSTQTITIGEKEYYILKEENRSNLYTGSTYSLKSWEYCTASNKKWLPAQVSIDLTISEATQTVELDGLEACKGNTYRIEGQDGKYTYYACFIYHPVDKIMYNVYAIDLSVAVATGALDSYQDTFDRSFPSTPDEEALLAQCLLKSDQNRVTESAFVVENAPVVSGYAVYENWSQELSLQSDPKTNNIFFYYVQSGIPKIDYSITYYLMTDGGYSADNSVTISNIPAVAGEIIPLDDLIGSYNRLLRIADTYSGYAGSSNEALRDLYERYKGMTITLKRGGNTTSFTVDSGIADTLTLADITALPLDYYLDDYTPDAKELTLHDGMQVEAYLATAQMVIQKTDSSGLPLQGAEFKLERLVENAQGTISYNNKNYDVDPNFTAMTIVTGTDGKAVFRNLSARILEEGNGMVYRLTETKSPQGYNRLTSAMFVTAPYTVNGVTNYSVTYNVVNSGISYLPESGILGGVYPVMFLGFGLMAAAAGGGILFWYRKKFGSDSLMNEDNSTHNSNI